MSENILLIFIYLYLLINHEKDSAIIVIYLSQTNGYFLKFLIIIQKNCFLKILWVSKNTFTDSPFN